MLGFDSNYRASLFESVIHWKNACLHGGLNDSALISQKAGFGRISPLFRLRKDTLRHISGPFGLQKDALRGDSPPLRLRKGTKCHLSCLFGFQKEAERDDSPLFRLQKEALRDVSWLFGFEKDTVLDQSPPRNRRDGSRAQDSQHCSGRCAVTEADSTNSLPKVLS